MKLMKLILAAALALSATNTPRAQAGIWEYITYPFALVKTSLVTAKNYVYPAARPAFVPDVEAGRPAPTPKMGLWAAVKAWWNGKATPDYYQAQTRAAEQSNKNSQDYAKWLQEQATATGAKLIALEEEIFALGTDTGHHINELAEHRADAIAHADIAQQEANSTFAHLTLLREELQNTRKKSRELQEALKVTGMQENGALATQLKTQSERIQKLETDLQQKENQITIAAQKNRKDVLTQDQQIRALFKDSQQKLDAAVGKLAQADKRLQNFNPRLDSAQKTAAEALTLNKVRFASLQEENERLQKNLQEQLAQMSTTNSADKAKIDALVQEIARVTLSEATTKQEAEKIQLQLINFKLKVADLEAANSRLKGEKDQIEKKAAESLSASNLSLSTLRRELEKKQRQSQLPQIDESQLTQSFQQLGLIDPQEESPVDLNEEHGSWFGEALRTVKSASLFHISRKANQYWYGDSITFDTINKKAGAERPLEPKIVQDKNGKILAIDDAKAPLVLGTIFENESHIQQIKKKSNVEETDAIGIYTLTRDFENYLSGLSQAVQNNAKIVWHKYPTTDYTAPAFINLMRAVRDLDTRDERGEKLAYVHCKAGRGRSAVTVAAYLMHVCNLAKTPVTLEQIELYMKEQRPQVSLNHHHKQMLQRFNTELEQSRSFRDLYKKYSIAIEKQDAVIDQYYSSNASSRPPVPAPEIKALEHKQ